MTETARKILDMLMGKDRDLLVINKTNKTRNNNYQIAPLNYHT